MRSTNEIFLNLSFLAAAIVLAIAAGTPLPIIGIIFGKIIDKFPPEENDLKKSLEHLMIAATVYFFVTYGWSCCWGIVGERVSKYYREALLEKALLMDLTYHELHCPDITSHLTTDTQAIQLGTSEKTGLFIQSISYFISAFAVGFSLNAKLTGILFAAVIPPIAICILVGSRSIVRYEARVAEKSAQAGKVLENAIRSVNVIKAFECADTLKTMYVHLLRAAERNTLRRCMISALMLGFVYFVSYSANALAFWQGSRLVTENNLGKGQAGTIYAVVFLILDASYVVGQFGPFLQTFSVASAAGERIDAILESAPSKIDVATNKGKPFPKNGGLDISFDNVTFTYPTRPETLVLEKVDLHFQKGTFTAIVGLSGSGKSTISNLLLRFYDPVAGKVLLAGEPLPSYNVRDYRSNVSLVDQSPCLFPGTIRENILHGIRDIKHHMKKDLDILCTQAVVAANAQNFIDALPDRLNTVVGSSNSTQLSGGQRARIALARALISNPQVLVLDEPTAALVCPILTTWVQKLKILKDPRSESLILDALYSTQQTYARTTIMITHRLTGLQQADQIIVMGEGAVIEQGSFRDLMEKGGAFFDLVTAQTGSASTSEETLVADCDLSSQDDKDSAFLDLDKHQIKANISMEDEGMVGKKPPMQLRKLFVRCLQLGRPEWLFLVLGLFCSILVGGIVVGEAIIFGHLVTVINTIKDITRLRSEANFYCLLFFVLALVALFAFTTSSICYGLVNQRLVRRIKSISFSTIMKQDISWFEMPKHDCHSLTTLCETTSGHITGLSGIFIGTILSVITSMIGGTVLALILSWRVAIVILAAVPVMLFAGFIRLRVLAKSHERQEVAYVQAAALAAEACHELRTIQAFGREQSVLIDYKRSLAKPYDESIKFNLLSNSLLAFALSVTYFVYALAYWWGAKQVRNGHCSVQNFFIILPALLFSAQASGQMFSLAPELTKAKSAAQKIFSLHDQAPVMKEGAGRVVLRHDTRHESVDDGLVEFRNVYFTYPSRPDNTVLNNINFSIKPGQFVAIVGESGAGKSSIISLLERFHDPIKGSILIDNQEIQDLQLKEHRERIALVSQTSSLFNGSIHFNIALGAPTGVQVSREDIENVCRKCDIHEFIMSLPNGYETDCARSGLEFSGGQLQRLAVARALIREPSILLLDEATSALDAHTESLIMQTIKEVSINRTTIMVTHRLTTIQNADCIYVMQQGQIVESGSHSDLMSNTGIYSAMFKQQSL